MLGGTDLFAPWLIAPASDASCDNPCVYAADNNKVCGRPDCRAKGINAPRIWSCCYPGERDADLFFAPPCQLSASACCATAFAQRAGNRPFSLPRRRLRRHSERAAAPCAFRRTSESRRCSPPGATTALRARPFAIYRPACLQRHDCADAGGHWLSGARQLAHRRSRGCPV
jgi:hypothetical protein